MTQGREPAGVGGGRLLGGDGAARQVRFRLLLGRCLPRPAPDHRHHRGLRRPRRPWYATADQPCRLAAAHALRGDRLRDRPDRLRQGAGSDQRLAPLGPGRDKPADRRPDPARPPSHSSAWPRVGRNVLGFAGVALLVGGGGTAGSSIGGDLSCCLGGGLGRRDHLADPADARYGVETVNAWMLAVSLLVVIRSRLRR